MVISIFSVAFASSEGERNGITNSNTGLLKEPVTEPKIVIYVNYKGITSSGLYEYEVRLEGYCASDYIKKMYAGVVSVYSSSSMTNCLYSSSYPVTTYYTAQHRQNVLAETFTVSSELSSCYVRMINGSVYLLTSGDWVSVNNYTATITTN